MDKFPKQKREHDDSGTINTLKVVQIRELKPGLFVNIMKII